MLEAEPKTESPQVTNQVSYCYEIDDDDEDRDAMTSNEKHDTRR